MTTPDHNHISFTEPDNHTNVSALVINSAADNDDELKLSGVVSLFIDGLTILGGLQRENAIDLNRHACRNLIHNFDIAAGRECAVLVKGGSNDNQFAQGVIKPGGHSEFYFGDYSDQSWEKTTGNVIFSVARTDGRPIRIRIGDAEWPSVQGCSYRRLYCLSFVSLVGVWGKRFWVDPRRAWKELKSRL